MKNNVLIKKRGELDHEFCKSLELKLRSFMDPRLGFQIYALYLLGSPNVGELKVHCFQ